MDNDFDLNIYKQEVVREIKQNYVPFYEQWLRFFQKRFYIPKLMTTLLFSLFPYLVGLLLLWLAGSDTSAYTRFWLQVNFSAWIAGMFLFMSYIYFKTVDFLDEIIFILRTKAQVDEVKQCYHFMFNSRWQIATCCLLGLVIAATGLIMGVPLDNWGTTYMVLAASLEGFLLGAGLWYTIASCFFVYRYSRFDRLHMNVFDPSRTVGIREIANILSTWGMCVIFECLLCLFGLYYADWRYGQEIVAFLYAFWSCFVFVMVAFVFLFPHILIKRLILSGKREGSKNFQGRIRSTFENLGKHTPEELELMEKEIGILRQCQEIYLDIIKSPSIAIDLTVIGKFFSALIVPMIILVFESPEYLMGMVAFIREFVSGIMGA